MSKYNIELYNILSVSLFWLAFLTCCIGLVMFLAPGWLLRISERVNLWIDTSVWFKKLDEQKNFERLFYRYHIAMGILIVAGSLYSLRFLWRLYGAEQLLFLPVLENTFLQEILQVALTYVLLSGNAVALLVGLVVLIRPSLLKKIEAWSNHWLETERVFGKLDQRVDLDKRIVPEHPRLFGLLVVIGSLFIMSNTWLAVF